jgi:hypothetical protein
LKKLISLCLTVIVFTLVCLGAIQHPPSFTNDHVKQSIAADNEFLVTDNVVLIEKSKPKHFPAIPDYFIFILLLCLIIQTKLKKHICSFIHLLKHYYLLFPIKYESRYLVQSPIHP